MIFVNQPYIITVDESGQIGSKIELFIWNDGAEPINPNYTFTKQIASATDTANYYNISPFLTEFIQFGVNETESLALLNNDYYVNYKVLSYKNVDGIYTLVDELTGTAMYGIESPIKLAGGLLNETTYEVYNNCDLNNCDTIQITYKLAGEDLQMVEVPFVDGEYRINDFLFETDLIISFVDTQWTVVYSFQIQATLTQVGCPFGTFTIAPESMFESFIVEPSVSANFVPAVFTTWIVASSIRWTDLKNGTQITETLDTNSVYVINANRFSGGTKLEYLVFAGVGGTWNFIPKCECTYEPIKVQYLNNYGALFTVWFYKQNKQEFSIENSEFKRFQNVVGNYYSGKQRQTFNTSGREKITVNSDWVNEDFSNVIKDIMLSEYTLVNDKFANIESKSIEIQQNINNGLINYQLTFTYSNDYRR